MSDPTSSPTGIDHTGPADGGLRSAPGIRWLLLAGALVTGVSIYRLVQSQWASMPEPLQFLILVAAALALFGLGKVTRERLRLPYAGSALLFLFTGLIPVLAWGTVYLKLLDTAAGWLAFSAGGAALMRAAVQVLRSELRYTGKLYPAALTGLLAAQPLVPWLATRVPISTAAVYSLAALLLGLVLYAGSRDANRFFFDRDRRDGVDRPLHLLPFLLLGVLYVGALTLLDLRSTLLALPLAVLGIVLVDTGEEYYRALADSLGHAPERWPRRSVALLALGFAFTVAALPLSLLDSTGHCLPLVAFGAAVLFLRWGWRYHHRAAHVAGVLVAFVAYRSAPALAPDLAYRVTSVAASALGLAVTSPLLVGWGSLGFLAALMGYGGLLARRPAGDGFHRTHGVLTALHLLTITLLACQQIADAAPMLAVALAMGLASVVATRRIEPVAVVPFLLAAMVYGGAQSLFAAGPLAALFAVGAATLALALATRFLEPGLARRTQEDLETARRALLQPASALSLLIVFGVVVAAVPAPLAGIDVMLAGAVCLTAGYRLRRLPVVAAGGLLLSLGAHAAVLLQMGRITPWTALLTQSFFLVSWLASRAAKRHGRLDSLVERSALGFTFLHGALALGWLTHAGVTSAVTIEPVTLLLIGVALLWMGVADRQHEAVDLGLAMAVSWAPVQVFFTGGFAAWSEALVASLILAGLEIALLIALARRWPGHVLARWCSLEMDDWNVLTAPSLRGLVRVWLTLAAAACLLFAGGDVLILALTMAAVLFLTRTKIEGWARRLAWPARLSLLPLLHAAVLAATAGELVRGLLGAVFLEPALLPWLAALGLFWRGLIEALGRRQTLRPWSVGIQLATAGGYLLAFVAGFHLSAWANATLIVAAAGWATWGVVDGRRDGEPAHVWWMQAWGGLAMLHAFTAGWLHFNTAVGPYVLLATGAGQYVAAAWLARTRYGPTFSPSCERVGLALPLLAGVLSLLRIDAPNVWFPALAVFLVSLFYTVVASRASRRVFPAVSSAVFLALALLKVLSATQLGSELYFLAPGCALLILACLLRTELGPIWSRHLAAAGASCVYATPVVALAEQISWGWLVALLLLAVAFGAASFALRSRSMLTVSTAALLTDLGFFVLHIDAKAPMMLWVLGLGFGLALMGVAAWLEYRREGVLQQIRVFGRELRAWS